MKKMDAKVCALVVTYNRSLYLEKLLIALCSQSVKLTCLVIFDNHSSDETQNVLVKMGFVTQIMSDNSVSKKRINNIDVYCVRSGTNTGGSGGFSSGIEFASKLDCDFIWCMDDDVDPAPDCLYNLLINMTKERRICIPNRTGRGYNDVAILKVDMSNPFKYSIKARKQVINSSEIADAVINVADMPFEGPLIDISLVNEIGFPNKKLFIFFDDSEYAMRALKHTTIGFVREAHLYKQIIAKKNSTKLMNWKNYYAYRNQYWFDHTYGNNVLVRIARPLLSCIDLLLRAIVCRKWSNIHVIFKAYIDGMTSNLGKTVEPGKRI